jgi:hypothetical protein
LELLLEKPGKQIASLNDRNDVKKGKDADSAAPGLPQK